MNYGCHCPGFLSCYEVFYHILEAAKVSILFFGDQRNMSFGFSYPLPVISDLINPRLSYIFRRTRASLKDKQKSPISCRAERIFWLIPLRDSERSTFGFPTGPTQL